MKTIIFKKVWGTNFLSIGSEPVIVDFKKGLNIIIGTNRDKTDRTNGSGKSSVAEIIYFAVFGETIRDIKKEFITNNITKKNCQVGIELDIITSNSTDTIEIVRTLGPSKCYLKINGEDKTRDTIDNTTEYIKELLSCTKEIFQNCIIMTINNTEPFMAKKKQDKRKFIEEIFELSIFSKMLKQLKEESNDTKTQLSIQNTKLDELNNTLQTYYKQRDSTTKEKNLKIIKYNKRYKDNGYEIEQINKNLNNNNTLNVEEINKKIQHILDNISKLDNKLTEVRSKTTELITTNKHYDKQLKNIIDNKSVCPSCLRAITDTDHSNIIQEKTSINNKIDENTLLAEKYKDRESKIIKAKDDLSKQLDKHNKDINEYTINLNNKSNSIRRLDQLSKWQIELQQDLTELETSSISFDNAIEEQQNKILDIKTNINTINTTLNKYESVKFILSEEGVKSYIVKKILELFNNKLQYYLKKMDANCVCKFNEYFEEDIIDDKGKSISYFNLSGAERKNVDLACLFAFMDVRKLQSNVSYNFSVYDELFDSSFDEKGIELVTDILNERVNKYNECLYVISHRRESLKAVTGEVIFLEKKNGITQRVEYLNYT